MGLRTKLAISLTVIYLVGFVCLIVGRWHEFVCLSLNELGDFLAGSFGPLALAWLVFGYFQQGDELKQGTAALQLQGVELKNSVEQQQKLADISRQALEHEREVRNQELRRRRHSLRPVLQLNGGHPRMENGCYILECELINHGSQVHDIQIIRTYGEDKRLIQTLPSIGNGQKVWFSVTWSPELSGGLDVEVVYEDLDGAYSLAKFTAVKSAELGGVDFIKILST